MIWWIVLGVVIAALLVLTVVLLRLLGGVRELNHVQRALQRRAGEARTLEQSLDQLRERAEALQGPLVAAQERAALAQARRGNRE